MAIAMRVTGYGILVRTHLFRGFFHAWPCGWPWKKAIKKKFRTTVNWKGEGEGYFSCTIWLGDAKQNQKFQALSSLYLLLISFLLTNCFILVASLFLFVQFRFRPGIERVGTSSFHLYWSLHHRNSVNSASFQIHLTYFVQCFIPLNQIWGKSDWSAAQISRWQAPSSNWYHQLHPTSPYIRASDDDRQEKKDFCIMHSRACIMSVRNQRYICPQGLHSSQSALCCDVHPLGKQEASDWAIWRRGEIWMPEMSENCKLTAGSDFSLTTPLWGAFQNYCYSQERVMRNLGKRKRSL